MINFSIKDWRDTLPSIDVPFIGESLIGYILRLCYLNNLSPNTVIKMVVPRKGYSNMNLDSIKEIESIIDYDKFAKFAYTSSDSIYDLSLEYHRKIVYGYSNSHTEKLLNYNKVAICPICFKDYKLPLIFFMEGVSTCLIHGVKLISECKCGAKVDLFSQSCHNKFCKKKYQDSIEPQSHNEIIKQNFLQYIYNYSLENGLHSQCPNHKKLKNMILKIKDLQVIKHDVFAFIRKSMPSYLPFQYNLAEQDTPQCFSEILTFTNINNIIIEFGLTPFDFINNEFGRRGFIFTITEVGIIKNTIGNNFSKNVIKPNDVPFGEKVIHEAYKDIACPRIPIGISIIGEVEAKCSDFHFIFGFTVYRKSAKSMVNTIEIRGISFHQSYTVKYC